MRSVCRGAALLAVLALVRTAQARPAPPVADGPTIPAPAAEGDGTAADPPSRPRAVPIVPSGLPAAAPARPAATPPTTSPPTARPWPAAFRTRKAPEPSATKQAAHVELETQAVPLTLPEPPADDPATLAEARRRVHMLYGAGPATVTLEPQPDGSVLVHVRVRPAEGAETPDDAAEATPVLLPRIRVLVEMSK